MLVTTIPACTHKAGRLARAETQTHEQDWAGAHSVAAKLKRRNEVGGGGQATKGVAMISPSMLRPYNRHMAHYDSMHRCVWRCTHAATWERTRSGICVSNSARFCNVPHYLQPTTPLVIDNCVRTALLTRTAAILQCAHTTRPCSLRHVNSPRPRDASRKRTSTIWVVIGSSPSFPRALIIARKSARNPW